MDKATLIEVEAQRIVNEMRNLRKPNSPNKTHYMVELSREFLVEDGRTDRLFSLLPYKTLSFSNLKDRKGIFAFVVKMSPVIKMSELLVGAIISDRRFKL